MAKLSKKVYVLIFIALLLAIVAFCVYNFVLVEKENKELEVSLVQAKEQAEGLQQEKQNLLQIVEKEKKIQEQLGRENLNLKETLKGIQDRLVALDSELSAARENIDDLNSKMAAVTAENTALREEKERLSLQATDATQAKEEYKAKLNSFTELKKTVEALKSQARKVGAAMIRKVREKKRAQEGGNQGYMLKNGTSTYLTPGKINIEVLPLPQE